jgi:amino acid transporter
MSLQTKVSAAPERSADAPVASHLKTEALSLTSVVMQGVTHIAPAIAIVLTIQFIASVAGLAAPLAYLIAFLIVFMLGVVLTQLAKHIPSAGGYYTYVSRSVHPRAGFLVSWLYIFYSPIFVGVILAAVGSIVHDELLAEYNFNLPWWLFLLIGVAVIGALAIRGIEISVRAMVIMGVLEMGLLIALGLFGLFDPGPGGVNLESFNPGNAPSANGLYLGVIFSIFAITGWEAAAALGEESENPRRNVPRGIIGSLLIVGTFLVLTAWMIQIGWGTDRIDELIAAEQLPPFILAHQFWGGAWVLLLIAAVNSAIAGGIAYTNVTTRMWYAMARSGSLPKPLAKVHPRYKTPVNAIALEMVLTSAIALIMGFWIGPFEEFVFFGVALTFALVFIYGAANLGVFLFYRRERRDEFNPVLHLIFPAVGTAALIWVAYKTVDPFPPAPNKWAPIAVAVWIALGVAILLIMRSRGKEEWLLRAGAVAQELPARDEAVEHRAPFA